MALKIVSAAEPMRVENLIVFIYGDPGIGIANTRRRLDLLYAGKHTLDIESDSFAKEYSITLTIQK